MKNRLLFVCILLVPISAFSQSKKVLEARINELSAKIEAVNAEIRLLSEQNKNLGNEVETLKTRLSASEKELQAFRDLPQTGKQPAVDKGNNEPLQYPPAGPSNRCRAITSSGEQCSRNAREGSEYCWQHDKSAEAPKSTASPANSNNSSGSREILTGPRGGKYYLNSSGKKTYIRRK